jgi:DNA-directed RNA polymerase subunit RPC12/RpoP
MIKCPHCSGELDFDIKDQVVKCPYCDSKFNPKEEIGKVKSAGERKANEYDTGVTKGKCYTCSQCGAQLVTFDDTAVTFCSYCDSQALIASEMDILNPKLIIPFKKTKEQAIDMYLKKIKSSLFAPNDFKNDIVLKKFRGIFMPYEIYDIESHDQFLCDGEKYSHRSGDYIIYNKFIISGKVDAQYDGISFDVSSGYSDDVSQAIPFDIKEAEEFNHNYLVGNYADTSDIDSKIYDDNAKGLVNTDLETTIRSNPKLFGYSITNVKTTSTIAEKKKGFFPVYFASFKNKNGDRIHYAIINGQNGKSAVDIPVDYKKYLFASLLLAVPIFFILQAIATITAQEIAIASLVILLIGFIIQAIDIKRINDKENHVNDEGFNFKNLSQVDIQNPEAIKEKITTSIEKKKESNNTPKKIKGFGLYIFLTALLPGFLLLIQDYHDDYYYAASIFSLVVCLLIFRFVVKKHNTFIARPLPQLNKRGGDENE